VLKIECLKIIQIFVQHIDFETLYEIIKASFLKENKSFLRTLYSRLSILHSELSSCCRMPQNANYEFKEITISVDYIYFKKFIRYKSFTNYK